MSEADEREQEENLDESQQEQEDVTTEDGGQYDFNQESGANEDSQEQSRVEGSEVGGGEVETSFNEEQSQQEAELENSRESPDADSEENTMVLGSGHETAAVKIQAVQRGIRDRNKVKEMKDKGELPAQARAKKGKPQNSRESVKSQGHVSFYDGIGSSYVGELLDGLPHGRGKYSFANGTVYEGEFVSGQFEGKGQFIFEGIGKVEATFVNGRAVGEALTFEDGLQYVPQGWKYCVEGDRRFYHEVVDPRFGLTD